MILFRWSSTREAREAVEADVLRPRWEHLLPGGPMLGICFGLHPLRWAEETGQRTLLLALDCPDLVGRSDVFPLRGDAAFNQTTEWRRATRTADETRAAALEACAGNALVAPDDADEVFLTASLTGIASRVLGAVRIASGDGPADDDAAWTKAWCQNNCRPWVELGVADLRDLHQEVEMLSLMTYLAEQLPGIVQPPDTDSLVPQP